MSRTRKITIGVKSEAEDELLKRIYGIEKGLIKTAVLKIDHWRLGSFDGKGISKNIKIKKPVKIIFEMECDDTCAIQFLKFVKTRIEKTENFIRFMKRGEKKR